MYQQVDFTQSFVKQLKKMPADKQRKFYDALRRFETNPYAPELRNHALKGKYIGYRSIDVAWDVRALYYVSGTTVVIFALIGSHSELYG